MDPTDAEVTTTSSNKQENDHRAMSETNNRPRAQRRTSRRERRERITAARQQRQQQQQPLRHHSDHVRSSSTVADDDFEAVAMVELERASTDAANVGDRLFAQQTSTFSVGRMSSSSLTAHHHHQQQEAAAPSVTPRIASTPLTPPAMIREHRHRRSVSESFNNNRVDSRSAMDSIDIRSTLRENHTRTQPGAYVATGPPVDVPTWMVHAANDNTTNGNRRFRLSQADRMDSVTFRRWLDSQQQQEGEEGQDETSMELFAAATAYDQDSPIDASVDVCVQATPITVSTPLLGGGNVVVGGNNSQGTLLEQSFNSIPPEYRPVCNTYTPPLSPTAISSSSSSEESDTNPQQEQQQQQQRTPKKKRVRKLMKKIKKVTIEVTKEIVDLM